MEPGSTTCVSIRNTSTRSASASTTTGRGASGRSTRISIQSSFLSFIDWPAARLDAISTRERGRPPSSQRPTCRESP